MYTSKISLPITSKVDKPLNMWFGANASFFDIHTTHSAKTLSSQDLPRNLALFFPPSNGSAYIYHTASDQHGDKVGGHDEGVCM